MCDFEEIFSREEPESAGPYLRFAKGVNRVRILSKPIAGIEEWHDKKVLRHDYRDKSDMWSDPNLDKNTFKRFWCFIIWNHTHSAIQIMNVTQKTIRDGIKAIGIMPEWGKPYGYDLEINRSGEDKHTKYTVTAMPHTPVSQEIVDAFHAKPCRLEALFEGEDPFAEWTHTTPMETVSSDGPKSITEAQFQEIVTLIGDDSVYLEKVRDGVKKTYNIESLQDLPYSHYDKVLAQVKLHAKERLEKEMEKKNRIDDDLPF